MQDSPYFVKKVGVAGASAAGRVFAAPDIRIDGTLLLAARGRRG